MCGCAFFMEKTFHFCLIGGMGEERDRNSSRCAIRFLCDPAIKVFGLLCVLSLARFDAFDISKFGFLSIQKKFEPFRIEINLFLASFEQFHFPKNRISFSFIHNNYYLVSSYYLVFSSTFSLVHKCFLFLGFFFLFLVFLLLIYL